MHVSLRWICFYGEVQWQAQVALDIQAKLGVWSCRHRTERYFRLQFNIQNIYLVYGIFPLLRVQ